MADNLVNSEEDRLLDASLPTTAEAITVKLRSTAPSESADGTAIAGNGYADQTMTVSAASGGSKSNTDEVLFPVATADWPEIQGYDLYVGGSRRWYVALAAGDRRTVRAGDQYRIAVGALTFSLS